MAKGYWIAHATITDPDTYKRYADAAPAVIEQFGGKFMARGGKHQQMEGGGKTRNVVIEFPSYDAAVDCFNSEGYQNARSHRLGAGHVDIVIVEGV
jgi:uncharacterized protein (DUF1330 family)